MVRLTAILAAAVLLVGCQPVAERAPAVRAFLPNTARIIGADDPQERLWVCQADTKSDSRWTPTQQEIDALEPVLIELLEYKLLEDEHSYGESYGFAPTGFHRHYFGLVRGDRRYILICGQHGQEPINMRDGGSSRFAALYDTRFRTFVWFQFGYRG